MTTLRDVLLARSHVGSQEDAHGALTDEANKQDGAGESAHATLSRHIRGVASLVRRVYGEDVCAERVVAGLEAVAGLPETPHVLACKKAALLHALYREEEVLRAFACMEGDDGFSERLCRGVLARTTRYCLRDNAQEPVKYLTWSMLLAEMWAGEDDAVGEHLTTTDPL